MAFSIAIFASGSGTNARTLLEHFAGLRDIKVVWIASGNPEAKVLDTAQAYEVPSSVLNREEFQRATPIIESLQRKKVDLLVLAGFMWKLPAALVDAYAGRIINTHPALLPAHGGKGMYGIRVHRSVLAHGDRESGFTAHYVTREYDEGPIIEQVKCPVYPKDTPETLQNRVKSLERTYFPEIVERVARDLMKQKAPHD